MEKWLAIAGYEGLYEVSNVGQIKSLDGFTSCHKTFLKPKKGKIRKPSKNRFGYFRIALCKDGIVKYFSIHRLVAISFIKNDSNKKMVNHINGIKTDNRAENLEWCTASENIQHAFDTGLKKGTKHFLGRIGKDCHNHKKVAQYDSSGKKIAEFNGASEAGRILGLQFSLIAAVARNKRPHTGGFIFKYI